jgi:CPA2 family monovalent cation:H+ antiporter-2
MTVLMPALGGLEAGRLLGLAVALGKAALVLGPFFYLASRVTGPLLTRVARARSPELLLLVALAIGLGTAALSQAIGLSLALGAFLAGLLISESDYAHETLARLLPLRDTFVALFFVTIGALVDPATLTGSLPVLAVMVGWIVVGQGLLWTLIVWLFRYPVSTALLVGIGLAQIGEFSFVLVQTARAAGHVGDDVYTATLAASLVTILINAALFRWAPRWVGRLWLSGAPAPEPAGRMRGHVVICGFGRVGSAVGEALETFHLPYVAIDVDPDVVQSLRARGLRSLYGDASRRELLEAAHAAEAALAVVAVADVRHAHLAVRELRAMAPALPILARAGHWTGMDDLRASGATDVVQPELQAAEALIRLALQRLPLPRERLTAYLERFHAVMSADVRGGRAAEGFPEVREVSLAAGPLADQSLRDARIRERFGVTVVGIGRGDEVEGNPSPDAVLRPGDRLRVFGLPGQIEAFRAEAAREFDGPSG